ncbi:hypothetical protein Tco_0324956 [Tanacetum coccineum]
MWILLQDTRMTINWTLGIKRYTEEEIDEPEIEAHYQLHGKVQEDDQNDVECDDECVALANLKLDVDENKKIQKQLKKENATLTQELTECKSILAETSRTLGESNSIRDSCLVALQNKQTEFERYKAFNDRTVDYDKLERLAPPRQMTSDHNSSELEIHDHSNELSRSKLVPKVVPPADKTATSRQELELLFHHHITMLRSTLKTSGKALKVEELKRKCMDKGKRMKSLHNNLRQKPGQYICCQNHNVDC